MIYYIALIHKDRDSVYGVSFPDVPGVIAAGDSIEAAMEQAAEALAFAAEDWVALTGSPFPDPRSIDRLRTDSMFIEGARDAVVVAAVPLRMPVEPA